MRNLVLVEAAGGVVLVDSPFVMAVTAERQKSRESCTTSDWI